MCAQADTDGWCLFQLDLLPYGFRTPAGHWLHGRRQSQWRNLGRQVLWSTLGRLRLSLSRSVPPRKQSPLPNKVGVNASHLTLVDCCHLHFSIETFMHSFVAVILWNLMLLTSPLCVARKNHNLSPVMGSVTYVAEDHAYLLIRMDLIVVGRHLWKYLELRMSGLERLVGTRSAKKKNNLKTCCILSVLRKKTAARDVRVTSHLRADLGNIQERLHRRHGHNRRNQGNRHHTKLISSTTQNSGSLKSATHCTWVQVYLLRFSSMVSWMCFSLRAFFSQVLHRILYGR